MASDRGGDGPVQVAAGRDDLERQAPVHTERDGLLIACRVLNIATVASLALCALGLAVTMVSSAYGWSGSSLSILGYLSFQIVRLYGIVLCLACILIETEISIVLARMPLMKIWVCRGFFYAFLASLTYMTSLGEEAWSVVISIAVVSCLSCALVYIMGGVLCVGFISQRRRNHEQQVREAERLLGVSPSRS